jgi:hypothetical protein
VTTNKRRSTSSAWLNWLRNPIPIAATRALVVVKGVVVCCVGLLEFGSSALVWRSPWGPIREDRPRILGMFLVMFGLGDLIWQQFLAERARRAWRYLVLTSAGLLILTLVVAYHTGPSESTRMRVASAASAAALIALVSFSSQFRNEMQV